MDPVTFDKEKIKSTLRDIKPYFNQKLGKYTHKQSSENFYFRSLAFSRDDMGYVFGFNVGFFKTGDNDHLNNAGMNVVIRRNGERQDVRQKYIAFFRDVLRDWINMEEDHYENSQRNGAGVILPRYVNLQDINREQDIIDFIKQSIDGLNSKYPEIIKNPNNLFFGVVRAAPFWNEDILSYCADFTSQ